MIDISTPRTAYVVTNMGPVGASSNAERPTPTMIEKELNSHAYSNGFCLPKVTSAGRMRLANTT